MESAELEFAAFRFPRQSSRWKGTFSVRVGIAYIKFADKGKEFRIERAV